jgi:hypothetical protein
MARTHDGQPMQTAAPGHRPRAPLVEVGAARDAQPLTVNEFVTKSLPPADDVIS